MWNCVKHMTSLVSLLCLILFIRFMWKHKTMVKAVVLLCMDLVIVVFINFWKRHKCWQFLNIKAQNYLIGKYKLATVLASHFHKKVRATRGFVPTSQLPGCCYIKFEQIIREQNGLIETPNFERIVCEAIAEKSSQLYYWRPPEWCFWQCSRMKQWPTSNFCRSWYSKLTLVLHAKFLWS